MKFSILNLTLKAENGVQIRNFLRVVKLAYNYESWDIFRRLSYRIIPFIEVFDLSFKFKTNKLHY